MTARPKKFYWFNQFDEEALHGALSFTPILLTAVAYFLFSLPATEESRIGFFSYILSDLIFFLVWYSAISIVQLLHIVKNSDDSAMNQSNPDRWMLTVPALLYTVIFVILIGTFAMLKAFPGIENKQGFSLFILIILLLQLFSKIAMTVFKQRIFVEKKAIRSSNPNGSHRESENIW